MRMKRRIRTAKPLIHLQPLRSLSGTNLCPEGAPECNVPTCNLSLNCTLQNVQLLCRGYKFGQRLYRHLFHYSLTVSLDGAFCRSKLMSNLLVDLTSHYEVEDLSLARRQLRNANAEHIDLGAHFA